MHQQPPGWSATKALCVVTPCKTREQFIERYHRFCDETAIFIATQKACPTGQDLDFSIQLADKTAMLRGAGCIEASFPTRDNRWKQPGIKVRIRRLTANSSAVFAKLQLHAAVASIEQLELPSALDLAAAPAPELTPTPEPPTSPALRVRFARAGSAPGSDATLVDGGRDVVDASVLDIFECTIHEDDGVEWDEEMIDLDLAPRLGEMPPTLESSTPAERERSRCQLDRRKLASVAIVAILLVVIASVSVLRMG